MEKIISILLPITIISVFLVILAILPICIYSSCKQARIYNSQNNTDYTCSDFFWASEQINSSTQIVNIK